MGELTQSVIAAVEKAISVEDISSLANYPHDLLAKAHLRNYHSGFADIDEESVSADEAEQLKKALVQALTRNHEPGFVGAVLGAMSRTRDMSLIPLYTDVLEQHLRLVKAYGGVVFAALIGLQDLGDDVFEREPDGSSSQGPDYVDKNIRQAQTYLLRRNRLVPW